MLQEELEIFRKKSKEEQKKIIADLVAELNAASEAYYNGEDEIMSNFEWDLALDELETLERETGIIFPNSPTQKVGAEIVNGERVKHEFPALSLDKSKNVADLQAWAGNRSIWLMWKCDGLTVVASYDNGKLTRLLSRGNGITGEDISEVAPYIKGLPMEIPYKKHLVVRAEAMISYSDFEKVNNSLDEEELYKNPRNLASGTSKLKGPRAPEVAERGLFIKAFCPVHFEEENTWAFDTFVFDPDSFGERMEILDKLGFDTVERELTTAEKLPEVIGRWTKKVEGLAYPVDGLVIGYEDYKYAKSGSLTSHHSKTMGFAFKWQDEVKETVLKEIEWSCAPQRITPVAVFEPVELEGTTVKRASLCNISELERLGIGGAGSLLSICKMNMIIPKCVKADANGTEYVIPDKCPVCGAPTEIRISDKSGTKTLHCTNDNCPAKMVRKFARFADKSGFDLDGLSEATFEALIGAGLIREYADIFKLAEHREKIEQLEGFGEKSFNNMISSIEARRKINPVSFMYALNIPVWGRDATKRVIAELGSEEFFKQLDEGKDFSYIEQIGEEKMTALRGWWNNKDNREIVRHLLEKVEIEKVSAADRTGGSCNGLVFCITGDVHHFANRDAFKAFVEQAGGKVTGSVTKKTSYLVTNTPNSGTSKNKTAQELGTPIITEDQFVEMFKG